MNKNEFTTLQLSNTANKAFGMNKSSNYYKFSATNLRGCYWWCSNNGIPMEILRKFGNCDRTLTAGTIIILTIPMNIIELWKNLWCRPLFAYAYGCAWKSIWNSFQNYSEDSSRFTEFYPGIFIEFLTGFLPEFQPLFFLQIPTQFLIEFFPLFPGGLLKFF